MKYFSKLIEKIEEIEDNFNVINSRIIEFGESIDYEHIDFGLVTKYQKILNGYLVFLVSEKENLGSEIDEDDKVEFQATRDLMQVRIEDIIKHIKTILIKVDDIVKIKKQYLSANEIKESFETSNQMENIEKLLKDFKSELKIYKKVQKLLGFNIDLDDKIEKEIEKKSKEEMIIIQKNFIEDTSDFLEEILNNKTNRLGEIANREDNLFKRIIKEDIYNNSFSEIFEQSYIVGLKLEGSDLYKHKTNFNKFNTGIDLLLDISTFCNDFDLNLATAKIYGLEELLLPFEDIKDFLYKNILNIDKVNVKELILLLNKEFGIPKLNAMFEYFDSFGDLIEVYKSLDAIDFDNINDFYESGFARFFHGNEVGENIISNIIKNHSTKLLIDFRKNNINIDTLLANSLDVKRLFGNENKSFLGRESILLGKLYKGILSSNDKISFYTYPGALQALKGDIASHLQYYKGYEGYFELIAFYNQAARNRYRNARQKYLAARRAVRRGGYSYGGSSGYSSGGGGWSSSSSSGSSSYSSSGSSSW